MLHWEVIKVFLLYKELKNKALSIPVNYQVVGFDIFSQSSAVYQGEKSQ